MKFSLNTIRFVNERYKSAGDPAPNGVDDLAQKIGAQLGAIEEIIDVGSKYQGVLIVKVVSCVDHPDADRLHLCKIDDGGKAKDVERDEKGLVQVVCGAPNVHEGMLAAWLPPGSTVPSTFDKEPFVLETREIRGQKSNGMLASPKELAIGDNHEGILEIDKDVAPGAEFATAYNLAGEVVIDIENKMFTHRPDCFGSLGIARELEGIQQRPYKSPDWYSLQPEFPESEAEPLPLALHNELPELVPRFLLITMRGVEIKPSPVWLQILLSELGLRPINNIVDYTNFFMLESGQPLHAYDYDKVKALSGGDGARLVVRNPKPGEKLTLLNGKTIEPRPEAIMIATDKQLIGVGGVMGGGDTEVDDQTTNVILECGNFDMYSLRRTSMAHGLFTDAVTRFNKGQSPLQNPAVLAKIVDEIRTSAGGKVAGDLIDDDNLPAAMIERGSVHPPVVVSTGFINDRLGLDLSAADMKTLLDNVEFSVTINGEELAVAAPFWRTDIELREDVVEEIGRLYGYDTLPLVLPKRDLTPAVRDPMLELKAAIRARLAAAGANEVLTYSFVHGNLLDKVGQDRSKAFQIGNALSPDLQYYRLSLTPSLLDKIHANIKTGYNEFAIFELGKVHQIGLEEDGVPKELDRIAFVFTADRKAAGRLAGAAYYQARAYAVALLQGFGLADRVSFETLDQSDTDQAVPYYEAGRAATIKLGDEILGRIGEYKASVRQALKLPAVCAGFELGLAPLLAAAADRQTYSALPRFPRVEQDITLKVAADMPYQELLTFVQAACDAAKPEQSRLTLKALDIFQREDDPDHKQVTFRLSIASFERTLTDSEVNKLLDTVAAAAHEKFNAERI